MDRANIRFYKKLHSWILLAKISFCFILSLPKPNCLILKTTYCKTRSVIWTRSASLHNPSCSRNFQWELCKFAVATTIFSSTGHYLSSWTFYLASFVPTKSSKNYSSPKEISMTSSTTFLTSSHSFIFIFPTSQHTTCSHSRTSKSVSCHGHYRLTAYPSAASSKTIYPSVPLVSSSCLQQSPWVFFQRFNLVVLRFLWVSSQFWGSFTY